MRDIDSVRSRFPSLEQVMDGRPVVFFDNPGGTQVPQTVIDAVDGYLLRDNANLGGAYATSERSDAMVDEARRAMADMLGAPSPNEIVFGLNMTTLAFTISRSLSGWVNPGDEIIVTRLDHDANISPWLLLARERGARVRWLDIEPEDCTLRLSDFENRLSDRTKVVACGYASNSVGTVNDVKAIATMSHSVGALVFVDAVHYAPHGPIDVQALDCDFLFCSAYKFFGPHVGMLWGKTHLLQRLPACKVRPAPDQPPRKFETGTQNHEAIAGTLAAVEYLASLGDAQGSMDRRGKVLEGMRLIQEYERGLCDHLLRGLIEVKGLTVYGIADPDRMDQRVPTVSFRLDGFTPFQLAAHLGDRGIFVWHGNYYAPALTQRLGLEDLGGMVRVGLVHYNTTEEVDRLLEELHRLTGS
ncbi:MAG: cysteine desulfurase-like protein [Deltaproteobacteria bacterium]|nr:cysteine desulfurase-like protein [Deltaproteobacteria bacterium]